MKVIILKTFLISLLTLAVSNANAAKLYKWVDANGNISYQDQPPPKNAKILSEKEVVESGDKQPYKNPNLPKIVVYSVDDCELCDRLVTVLRVNEIPHVELPLEDDREAQSKILNKASSIIAPTIFIGEDIIQGGNEEKFREELRSAGFEIKNSDNRILNPEPTQDQ